LLQRGHVSISIANTRFKRERGEYAVVSGEVDPRRWHERGQPSQEVERLDDHVRRSVAIRRFQLHACSRSANGPDNA
jgi:hypothetical protein